MRLSRTVGFLLAGSLTLAVVSAGPATATSAVATPASTTITTAGRTAPIIFGLGSHTDPERRATEASLGVKSGIVGSFATRTNSPRFWTSWARDVRAGGAVLQLFWDPTFGLTDNPNSSLRSIINGEHDEYIRSWTAMVRDYGHPVVIRLMAEMNGNWQPFSPGINGNQASEFPRAWRHVVDIARSQSATNILWTWNPNKPSRGSTPLAELWPGSAYVDWVGLDVYNWGDAAHGPWTSFSTLMAPAVAQIRAVAGNKPLMLNEVGTNSVGGNKAAWLTEMFASLPSFGIKAVVYFDYAMQGADWRLSAPATAMAAARTAVHAAPYVTGEQAISVTERLMTDPSTPAPHAVSDFDGNGSTDLAVYRPSTGAWYVNGGRSITWGKPTDLPVPMDYNGDGRTEVAVWRPTDGRWYIPGSASVAYGLRGDVPVPADYNGDGRADLAVFRPATGTWWVRGLAPVRYGLRGDVPVPADYNGDGRTDLAVFRPATGTWWVRGLAPVRYGNRGDVPVPADYTNDGRTDLAVFRPTTSTWYVRGGVTRRHGSAGDVPVPGDYNADGAAGLAVYTPSTGTWSVLGRSRAVWGMRNDDSQPLPQAIRGAFGM